MTVVGIGIIGCGVMGRQHAEVAASSADMKLRAVADLRPDVAGALAAQYGAEAAYDSAEALLADEQVQAVVLAMPTGMRAELALRALQAGKHLLLEKPAARNVGEIKQLLAARGDRVVAVCSCRFRFWKSAQVAEQCIADGRLGDFRVVHFRAFHKDNGPRQNPPAWRVSRQLNGGGFWVNWGCYDLDYLMGITGWALKPRLVLAQTWPIAPHLNQRVAPGSDAEEHALAMVQCEGGAVLSMERGEAMSIDVPPAWQVIGAKASLRLQMTEAKDNQVLLDQTHPDGPLTTEILWRGGNDARLSQRGPLEDLVRAIRQGTPPMTDLNKALIMQRITDAIYQSAAEQRAVAIA